MSQLSFDTPDTVSPRSSSFATDLQSGVIAGHVEKVVFMNPVTGQCLLDVKPEGAVKGHFMVAGAVASVFPGQSIIAKIGRSVDEGEIKVLPATSIEIGPPLIERTMRKFLKSAAMSELSTNIAKSLVETFPQNLFAIMDLDPRRLGEAEGVGNKRRELIIEAWEKFKAQERFKKFLFAEQLPLDWADQLWLHFDVGAMEHFVRAPYAVARDYGLSFDLVDAYALRRGFSLESEERLRCALTDMLQENYKQGHCAYPEGKLLEDAARKLNCSQEGLELALEIELIEKKFVGDRIQGTACIYLRTIWELEQSVARMLRSFEFKDTPWGWFNLEKVLSWSQSILNLQLAPLQKEAIETALSSPLTVITGGPGTGKTTLVRALTTILQTQFLKFALCTPTGRAAKRLEETTGQPAQTIHRLLKLNGLTGEFAFNSQNQLDVDLVLVDEISMVDIALMKSLLEALPDHCALILVGDADQIPPVGAGNILQSIIDSERFTVVRLKEIFRQSERSLIKINAQRINAGEMPLKSELSDSDFHYVPVHGNDEAKRMIFDLATRVIPKDFGITDMKQVQILVPMNTGTLGTQKLNIELQRLYTDQDKAAGGITGLEQSFAVGDKVMVIKNDYKKNLFNGDIGFIRYIDHAMQFLDIEFEDRRIRFEFEELDRLSLAYAISIHKSQGSEYRAVIVVITGEHLPMAQRHLIYTAVTRGKELVFLVAEPQALQTAIASDENNRRWDKLTELLRD